MILPLLLVVILTFCEQIQELHQSLDSQHQYSQERTYISNTSHESIQNSRPYILTAVPPTYVNNDGSGDYATIHSALGTTQTSEIQISLSGPNHTEQVTISNNLGGKRSKISISGDGLKIGNQIQFSGGSEIEGEGLFIFTVTNDVLSDIQINKIEMIEWFGGFIQMNGGKSLSIQNCEFIGGGTIAHNIDGKLDVQQCNFFGYGTQTIIDSFLTLTKGNINIVGSTFKFGSFSGERKGCIVCSELCSQCVIEQQEFIDNKLNFNSAAVQITSELCTLLSIKGTVGNQMTFSGLKSNDPLSGHFIKSVALRIEIQYVDFRDATFSDLGNAITILNNLKVSEITFDQCNFTNIRGITGCQRSCCIYASLSNSNGFKFNSQFCRYSHCIYGGIQQQIGNSITVQALDEVGRGIFQSELFFSDCIFQNNTGLGYGGVIVNDINPDCKVQISYESCMFSGNIGTQANDLWIKFDNRNQGAGSKLSHLSSSSIITNNNIPNIKLQIGEQNPPPISISKFSGVMFVSNQAVTESRDGSLKKPFESVSNALVALDHIERPIQFERTIYILDEEYHASISVNTQNRAIILKSGLIIDQETKLANKVRWTTEQNDEYLLNFNSGILTLESFHLQYSKRDSQVSPYHNLILAQPLVDTTISLTIISCLFSAIDTTSSVKFFINISQANQLILKDSVFRDAQIDDRSAVQFQSELDNSYLLILNCQFLNIHLIGSSFGTIFVDTYGSNANINIIQSVFNNCSNDRMGSGAMYVRASNNSKGINSQYVISNNIIKNCIGYNSGGIQIEIYTPKKLAQNSMNSLTQIGWNEADYVKNQNALFEGCTSTEEGEIEFIFASGSSWGPDIDMSEYHYFVDSSAQTGGTGESGKPFQTINEALIGIGINSLMEISMKNTEHQENIVIDENKYWKNLLIQGKEGIKLTTLKRINSEIDNLAIITLTINSQTPTTVKNVNLQVDSGLFAIQQSKRASLTFTQVAFIGAGTVKQEGLASISIEQCTFTVQNDITTSSPFISALRGQLNIYETEIGSEITTFNLGAPSVSISSFCTDINIQKTNFINLNSNITGNGISSAGISAEVGERTSISISECVFKNCTDSSPQSQISSGAVNLFSKTIIQQSFISSNSNHLSPSNLKHSILNAGELTCLYYGITSITNCEFTGCSGQQAGGIIFGDNVYPISARNNTFSSNIRISQTGQGASDIFFSSKTLLDSAGGIASVCEGYKYYIISGSETQGEVMIKGVSANFAIYLNCITEGRSDCGDISSGGQIDAFPKSCVLKDEEIENPPIIDPQDEDEQQEKEKGNVFPIGVAIGVAVGVLVIVAVIVAIIIAVVVTKKKKKKRNASNSDPDMRARNLPMEIQYPQNSKALSSVTQLIEDNNW